MSAGARELRRAQPWLGTLVSIRLCASVGLPSNRLHALMDEAFAVIARIHGRMSYHAANSTLTQINRFAAGRPVQTDPDTQTVLRAALDLAAASQGAFDPTVAAKLEDWGYLPRLDAAPAEQHGNWRDVEICSRGLVRLHRPVRIDLGGIAKGYAVDQASAVLSAPGIESFVVNAGGDLRVGGAGSQTISLRDPRSPGQVVHQLELHQGAIATSGSYLSARQFRGREVSQLVDARHRSAFVQHGVSVSVRAARCMHADALTKIVLLADPGLAEALLAHFVAEAIVLQAPPPRSSCSMPVAVP